MVNQSAESAAYPPLVRVLEVDTPFTPTYLSLCLDRLAYASPFELQAIRIDLRDATVGVAAAPGDAVLPVEGGAAVAMARTLSGSGSGSAQAADVPDVLHVPTEAVDDTYCVDCVFEGNNAQLTQAQSYMALPLRSLRSATAAAPHVRSGSLVPTAAAPAAPPPSATPRAQIMDDGEMLVHGPIPWTNHTVRLVASAAAEADTGAVAAAAADTTTLPLALAGVTLLYHRRAPSAHPMHTVRLVPEWRPRSAAPAVRRRERAPRRRGRALLLMAPRPTAFSGQWVQSAVLASPLLRQAEKVGRFPRCVCADPRVRSNPFAHNGRSKSLQQRRRACTCSGRISAAAASGTL